MTNPTTWIAQLETLTRAHDDARNAYINAGRKTGLANWTQLAADRDAAKAALDAHIASN